MSSASYKLFLVDLDGTLIGSDSKISPEVSRAVARVSGILDVAIATGRERAHVIRFARELGLSTPQLADGGAMILDPLAGTAIWSSPLGRLVPERSSIASAAWKSRSSPPIRRAPLPVSPRSPTGTSSGYPPWTWTSEWPTS